MQSMFNNIAAILLSFAVTACVHSDPVIWQMDALTEIGGFPTVVSGNPQVVETPYGKAVTFDGVDDRILIDNNPLGDAEEFTVEIIFKPNGVFPDNQEPRFFHIEAPDNPQRRITIELRLNDKNQWYLDTYIKSELSQHTLIDEALVHPVEEWAHAAITYKDRQFSAYVNGKKELSAEVDYQPIAANGQTSIGARMNQVHWFNGAILAARITHKLLEPEAFLRLESFLVDNR